MKIQLPESIVSAQDATAVIGEIRAYAGWLGRASVKQRLSVKTADEPPALSQAALALIKQWGGPDVPLNQEGLGQLADALEEFVEAAPGITFTLAAVPPGSLKKSLVSWSRQNLSPDILVNFKFNANLLGGLVVNYGSHIFDWSFRRQILESKAKFPGVLRRV